MVTTSSPAVDHPSTKPQWRSLWQIGIPLLVQIAVVTLVPAQKAYTLATGTTVFLKTAPVDPYDLLRGRYVTLNYTISNKVELEKLPGWSEDLSAASYLYVTLKPGATARDPWIATTISATYPAAVPAGSQVIRGQWNGWQLHLGLEEYYMPEQVGDPLEAALRKTPELARAEAKVDAQGNSAIVKVWIADQAY